MLSIISQRLDKDLYNHIHFDPSNNPNIKRRVIYTPPPKETSWEDRIKLLKEKENRKKKELEEKFHNKLKSSSNEWNYTFNK